MANSPWRRGLLAATITTLAFGLAACGSSSGHTGSTTPASTLPATVVTKSTTTAGVTTTSNSQNNNSQNNSQNNAQLNQDLASVDAQLNHLNQQLGAAGNTNEGAVTP